MTSHEVVTALAKQMFLEGYEIIGASQHPTGLIVSFNNPENNRRCLHVANDGEVKEVIADYIDFGG